MIAFADVELAGCPCQIIDLPAVSGEALQRLPWLHRIFLERFRFMKWATQALANVTVHPPGTGIIHTINLERLATVVAVEARDGVVWAVPDTLIGTDSHTPMINGIGVAAWGVGGLEAESVMFGMPVIMRIPEVVGVRLTSRLGGRLDLVGRRSGRGCQHGARVWCGLRLFPD